MVKEKYIGEAKIKDKPKQKIQFLIGEKAVKNKHLDDSAIDTNKIANNAVTLSKLSPDAQNFLTSALDTKYRTITDSLDYKYSHITEELRSMIASLQVGGIALSQHFGDREDIGISQKTLTKALGAFWREMERITERTYMDFTLSVVPVTTFSEHDVSVEITANCSASISDFDRIQLYVDDVLVAESSDVEIFMKTVTISTTSVVKAVGVILGKSITKTSTVVKEIPFFIGSGNVYTDVMNTDCLKHLDGTIEGNYDMTVHTTGQYIFIIIPISQRSLFRRADMNGYEISMAQTVMQDYVIWQSLNTYQAGEYNIDIDINS